MKKLTGLVLIAALASSSNAFADDEKAHPFEVPASLLPAVGFWVRVYSEWDTTKAVIHDSEHIDVIYRVLDLSEFTIDDKDSTIVRQQKTAGRMEAVLNARTEIEEALRELDEKRPESARGLKGAQLEAFTAWQAYADNPDRFGDGALHVRSQRGIADKYAQGYRQSGRFLGAIQEALREAGHPEGLVALAFTESLMYLHARSSSGAVGPWQFLSGTGREYLAINSVVDERKDPILSTLAAARYLHNSKTRLGSWGAAITAYNYGTNGMSRAVAELGTSDIETILREYKTSRFGFAAKNYYAEFLASLHVLSHADVYFKGVKPQAPWQFDVVTLPRPVKASELWAAKIDRDDVQELNPALTAAALAGTAVLPAGLAIRVPTGTGKALLAKLSKDGHDDAVAIAKTVTVKRGQTLMAVARANKVTLGELCAANGISPTDPVNAGTSLKIPAPRAGFTTLPEAEEGKAVAVTFAKPQPLKPHAPSLASRRPAPEPIVIAFGDDKPAAPAIAKKPPPPDLTLTSALPMAGDDDEKFSPVVLGFNPEREPPMLLRVPHVKNAHVVAGPAVQLVDDDMDGVDVMAGDTALPEIDMTTGGDRARDGTPHETLPVIVPASHTEPQS